MFYVGAIGSRRNTASRKQRFIDYFDETETSVKRLHAPVGLHIGSKTPAEIAVSIMAEILAVKNGVLPSRAPAAIPAETLENPNPGIL
jgi:xanthine dehydrogenase accessory factor